MRHVRVGALVLLLSGCSFGAAPAATVPTSPADPAGLSLFRLNLELRLDQARAVQELPGFWNEATVSLEASRLKAPLVQHVATSSTQLSLTFMAPPGPATVSVELGNGVVMVGKGATPTTLVAGNTAVSIALTTLLDFSGRVDNQ